jgi:hypothetical protein
VDNATLRQELEDLIGVTGVIALLAWLEANQLSIVRLSPQ